MKTREVTVTRIGNSRGVRLPAEVLRRYRIGASIILEEHPDQIVLRPKRSSREKLGWEQTYLEMAQSAEDWSGWEKSPEGLQDMPGEEERETLRHSHRAPGSRRRQ